jgi:hypothetical protein
MNSSTQPVDKTDHGNGLPDFNNGDRAPLPRAYGTDHQSPRTEFRYPG